MTAGPYASDCMLKTARGFSSLFWGVLWLAIFTLSNVLLHVPGGLMLFTVVGFIPLMIGLRLIRLGGSPAAKKTWKYMWLAFGLCPFRLWWGWMPEQTYFAVNMLLFYVACIFLMVSLHGVVARFANENDDAGLRREARIGQGMVWCWVLCAVAVLWHLFYKIGWLSGGLTTILVRIQALSVEVLYLFMLPYFMTLYILWRAKEQAFQWVVHPAKRY